MNIAFSDRSTDSSKIGPVILVRVHTGLHVNTDLRSSLGIMPVNTAAATPAYFLMYDFRRVNSPISDVVSILHPTRCQYSEG